MKRLFSSTPDVPQSVANRAIRIIERHLRIHRVDRARDLPEEAKVRLYRDLRLFFDSDSHSTDSRARQKRLSVRGVLSRVWERLQSFLSVCEGSRESRAATVFTWVSFADCARPMADLWCLPQGKSA